MISEKNARNNPPIWLRPWQWTWRRWAVFAPIALTSYVLTFPAAVILTRGGWYYTPGVSEAFWTFYYPARVCGELCGPIKAIHKAEWDWLSPQP